MKLPKTKKALILLAALVTPGGLVALALWKAYDTYKKKQAEKLAKPKTIEEYIEQLKVEVDEKPE